MPMPKPPAADASFEVHEHFAINAAMPILRDAAASMAIRGTEFAFYWPYGEDKFAATGFICSSCAKPHGSILYKNGDGEMVERQL